MNTDDRKQLAGNPGLTRRGAMRAAILGTGLPLMMPRSLLAASSPVLTPQQAMVAAESRREELIGLLSDLIRIRSLSGESGDVAQGVVMDYLSALPYAVEESRDRPSDYEDHPEYMPPSPAGDGPFSNVVARPKVDGSRYALFAHIDTHLLEDGWVSDPFEPLIRGSRLYGLGAGDDKGGIAAMLVAAAALSDMEGLAPIVISSHGKGGGSRGSLPVFQRMNATNAGIDAMLYVHPAETGRGLADIKHAVRGVLDFSITVEGWQGQPLEIGLPDSALWHEGGNALTYLEGLLEHLRSTVLGDVDVNVGRLEAGQRPGAVPDAAHAQIRLLFDSRFTWRELLASIEGAVESYALAGDRESSRYSAHAASLGRHSNAGEVPWDAPATLALRDAIEGIKGRAPASYPNHYGGDIRYPLRLLGAPSFGIGSLGGNFYGPNEWIDIDDLVNLVAVVILTVSNWKAQGLGS